MTRFHHNCSGTLIAVVCVALLGVPADAAQLRVEALIGHPTVILDGGRLGSAPITVEGVMPGGHELAFSQDGQSSPVFGQHLDIPKDADLRVLVDFEARAIDVQMITVEPPRPVHTPTPLAPVAEPRHWPRVVLNSGVTVAGLGLGGLAGFEYVQARGYYQQYVDHPNQVVADRIYEAEVLPRRRRLIAESVGSAILLAGGVVLWGTSDLSVGVSADQIWLSGRW